MIVGVTGHQDLGGAVAWVRQVLADQIAREDATLGLTSLALGTDQLFAEVLLDRGVPYEAIIPSAGYEKTFVSSARAHFEYLLAQAMRVDRLPYGEPTEASFFAAGRVVVSRCSLLLAVWDGEPARGLGGTGDVVELARQQGRRWIHINPQQRSIREGAAS